MNQLLAFLLFIPFFLHAETMRYKNGSHGFSAVLTAPSEVEAFQPFHIHLILDYPKGYTIDPVPLIQALLSTANPLQPQIELLNWTSNRQLKEEQEVAIFDFDVRSLTEDPLVLSFLSFSFQPKEGKALETVESPVFKINIHPFKNTFSSLYADTLAPLLPLSPGFLVDLSLKNREELINNPRLLEYEAQRNTRLIQQHTFPWLLTLLLAMFSLILLLRKKIKGIYTFLFPIKTVQKTAKEWAIDELNSLKTLPLDDSSNFITFYRRLNFILRGYIQKEFGHSVSALTSQEIYEDILKESPFKSPSHLSLQSFFKQTDLVKFANSVPSTMECEQAFQFVENFIHQYPKKDVQSNRDSN